MLSPRVKTSVSIKITRLDGEATEYVVGSSSERECLKLDDLLIALAFNSISTAFLSSEFSRIWVF